MLTLALAMVGTGCKKRNPNTTPIPGRAGVTDRDTRNTDVGSSGVIDSSDTSATDVTTVGAASSSEPMNSGPQDREALKAERVQFDLDSATIKKSEKPKLDRVAAYMKANPAHDVLIEGHCDERGTEGYNLSLGERRAMAAREYLISVGANGKDIYTISYGETRPIEPLHSDAAYSKNRRGEFVVALPAQ